MITDRHRIFEKAKQQIQLLQNSSRAFDNGSVIEAIRLSNSVTAIAFDGGRNFVSMLTHLGSKGGVPAISTSRGIDRENLAGANPLVDFYPTEHRYKPCLDRHIGSTSVPLKSIDEWWQENVILAWQKECLTRSDIIRTMRDKEGGSHVAAELKEGAYRRIVEDGETVFRVGNVPVRGVELATARQIAWELEASILLPVAMRTLSEDTATLIETDLFLSKRPFAVPASCEVIAKSATDGKNLIALTMTNFGGLTCEAKVEISASVDLPMRCHPEALSYLAGGDIALAPHASETLGIELQNIAPDVFRAVDRKELAVWICVRVRYADREVCPPDEGTIFRYSGHREFGGVPASFADRRIFIPKIS